MEQQWRHGVVEDETAQKETTWEGSAAGQTTSFQETETGARERCQGAEGKPSLALPSLYTGSEEALRDSSGAPTTSPGRGPSLLICQTRTGTEANEEWRQASESSDFASGAGGQGRLRHQHC